MERTGRVKIVRAEHFKLPLEPESERAKMQRVFRERLQALGALTEEAVIVSLAVPRMRWVGDKKLEWQDVCTKDHLHKDVQKFRDLIDVKRSARLEITTKDAVHAYLLVFGNGRKSEIAGFLWALRKEYPEFAMKHRPEKRLVKVAQLFGPPIEEEREVRIPVQIGSVDELVSTVGQALSRLRAEGKVSEAGIGEVEGDGLGEF